MDYKNDLYTLNSKFFERDIQLYGKAFVVVIDNDINCISVENLLQYAKEKHYKVNIKSLLVMD